MKHEPCQANTKSGSQCRGFAVAGGQCIAHSPEHADMMREARAKGARRAGQLRVLAGQRARLDTLPKTRRWLENILYDLLAGDVDAEVARVAVAGVGVLRTIIETSDLKRRITAIERAASDRKLRAVR